MGVWGPNTFENDHAIDFLLDFIDNIIEQARQIIEDPIKRKIDELGEIEFMPLLEIAIAIANDINVRIPSKIDFSIWKNLYLTEYDSSICEFASDTNYIRERRAEIIRKFDRLIELSRAIYE